MDWLVHMRFAVPEGTPPTVVDQRRQAEAVRAAELGRAGHLQRLWRVPGQWANWGIWTAVDATELDALLSSLPLRSWAEITVHALAEHPHDPHLAR